MKDVEKIVDSNGVVMQIVDGAARDMIAAEYDETESYAVGDYCIYDDHYYKCNTAIASGGETWDATHWDATTLGAEDKEIKQSLLEYWSTSATPTVPAGTSGDLEFAIPAAYQSGYIVASYAIYSGSKVVKPYVFEITPTKITYYVENTSGGSIARQITIKVLFQKV